MNQDDFILYLKQNNKKHIIFDFDKTICTLLIDWKYWHSGMLRLLQSYDPGFNPKNVQELIEAQNIYVKKNGKELRDKIIDLSYIVEKSHITGYTIIPKVFNVLPIAQKYGSLYIWTSNDVRTIAPILKELNIESLFQKVITRNDVNFIKPDIDGFRIICNNQTNKSEYLLIGDSEGDRLAAINSGIDFIHVNEFAEL